MSTPENQDARGRLLTYLFWGGIGVAPLAALLLIVVGGSTTGLRFAAFLAILAVVAIGLSVTLRRDATSMKLDIEETLLDEIDMLRQDVRADITTAARATHRALSEKVAQLHETVDHVRRQVDAGGFVELDRAPIPPTAIAGPPRRPAVGGPAAPPGVVQRTETVRVTMRTIVDPQDEDPYQRGTNGRPAIARAPHDEPASRGRREWDEPQPQRRPALPAPEDSWSDQRVARGDYDNAARQVWREPANDDPADDPRWSGMRGGDRWAEVRQDEHGRELRMGERRTAIRTDETGTQMRIVDRWSSVREERGHHVDSSATFENTGETRAQRRAREAAESAQGPRAALPSAERPRDEALSRHMPARDPWSQAEQDEPEWSESRSERRRERSDRDDRGPRDNGFVPRPLEQSHRDDHGYAHEVERIPAQRQAEPQYDTRAADRSRRETRQARDAYEDRDARDTRSAWDGHEDRNGREPELRRHDRPEHRERFARSEAYEASDRHDRSSGSHDRSDWQDGSGWRGGDDRDERYDRDDRRSEPRPAASRDAQWPPPAPARPVSAPPPPRERGDERADNRWERESSGQRSQMRRQYDFEVNDERWR